MHTGTQERDDETGPARLLPVVSGPPHERTEFISIGDLAAVIVSDAAVKLRGNFTLPRLVALAIREDEDRQSR